jgi:hypothetical protein
MKKIILLISVGVLNTIHALTHIIQFIQSMFLLSTSLHTHETDSVVDNILHSPYLTILWGVIGITSLVVGIKDFIHHKKCNH